MYKLLQNQAVRNFRNEINDLGWEEAGKQFPAVKAARDVQFRGTNNRQYPYRLSIKFVIAYMVRLRPYQKFEPLYNHFYLNNF